MGIRGVALADGQAHEHGVRVHDVHAAHLHVRQTALGGSRSAHGHKTRAIVCLLGDRGGVGLRHFGSAVCKGAGTVAEGNQSIAFKACGYRFALLHRNKACIHIEAVAKLIETAINDKLRACLTAQRARGGEVDALAAALLQLARGVHRHHAHAVLL